MRHVINRALGDAKAYLAHADEIAATAGVEREMRALRELVDSKAFGRQMQDLQKTASTVLPDQATMDAAMRELDATLDDETPPAAQRFTVEVKTKKPAGDDRPQRSDSARSDSERPAARSFILQQMIEAKDEAAQAACCRYILRNRLLG